VVVGAKDVRALLTLHRVRLPFARCVDCGAPRRWRSGITRASSRRRQRPWRSPLRRPHLLRSSGPESRTRRCADRCARCRRSRRGSSAGLAGPLQPTSHAAKDAVQFGRTHGFSAQPVLTSRFPAQVTGTEGFVQVVVMARTNAVAHVPRLAGSGPGTWISSAIARSSTFAPATRCASMRPASPSSGRRSRPSVRRSSCASPASTAPSIPTSATRTGRTSRRTSIRQARTQVCRRRSCWSPRRRSCAPPRVSAPRSCRTSSSTPPTRGG
jgi:hypothetical protein